MRAKRAATDARQLERIVRRLLPHAQHHTARGRVISYDERIAETSRYRRASNYWFGEGHLSGKAPECDDTDHQRGSQSEVIDIAKRRRILHATIRIVPGARRPRLH